MSFSINATAVIIAIATFLWYRKGKLWNFYDSILSDCLDQINDNSLDRKAWQVISRNQNDHLSQETFQSLFRFELEYLRQRVIDNQFIFWIPDSEESTEVSDDQEFIIRRDISYHDKEQYCKYRIRNMFYSEFRFCGYILFVKALRHRCCKSEDTDTGYIERSGVVGRLDPNDTRPIE